MGKYTDDEIRAMKKITCKIAADYLGIAPMAVSIGMQQDRLPIGLLSIIRIVIPTVGLITSSQKG